MWRKPLVMIAAVTLITAPLSLALAEAVALFSMWCASGQISALAAETRLPPTRLTRLASADWSVKGPRNLAREAPSQKEVESFVASVENSILADSSLGVEGGTYVCSFSFADFRRDGFLSLFVGIGVRNRPSCGDLEVIDKTKTGFELYQSGGSIGAGQDIPADIKDSQGDGHLQFLLHSGLAVIPERCIVPWTAIFSWTGNSYENVSARFKNFYVQRLEFLKKVIPALQPTTGASGYARGDRECLDAEAAAIERFLSVSPDAGLQQAIRLANSTDRAERDFASQLLGEIGTQEARKYLQKLVNDPENTVAIDAKSSLSMSANGPMKIVPDSFKLVGSVSTK